MSNKVIKSVSIFLLIFFLFNFSENENKSTLNDLLKNKKQSKVNNKEELTNDDKENEDTKDKGFDKKTVIKLLSGAVVGGLVFFGSRINYNKEGNMKKIQEGESAVLSILAASMTWIYAFFLYSNNEEEKLGIIEKKEISKNKEIEWGLKHWVVNIGVCSIATLYIIANDING
jgi:hypothetical protein